MKFFVLNSKPADPNGYIFQALVRALRRQARGQCWQIDPDDLGQLPDDPGGQSLLVYGGEELRRIPAERLQRPFGRRAVWFTEDPYELTANRRHAELFQGVFSNDSGSVCSYPQARHLLLAADADLLKALPVPLRSPSRLAFFSGTAWPNRKHLVAELFETLEDPASLDIHLVANAVVEASVGVRCPGLAFNPPIPISEFTLRAAHSLCTLVIGRDFSGSGRHAFAQSPGPRLFEAGITGSCQLVHAGEIPDMPADLLEGVHFLRFHTTAELSALLEEARRNPERFRAIGAAMADRIRHHHTYDQRASTLLEALGQLPSPESIHLPPSPPPSLRLLFLSHEQAQPGFHHGGAGLCLQSILAGAPAEAEVRVLCRAGDDGHRFELLDGRGQVVGGFRCRLSVDEFSLHHPEFEEHFEQLLADWQPQLVHVNHLIGFTPAVIPLSRRAGARTVITLHDYFVLCDSWNLLNSKQRFCAIESFFDSRCSGCTTARRPQFASVDPLKRRVVMAEALTHAHQCIVPSAAAAAQLQTVFPHLPAMTVIEPVPEDAAVALPGAVGDELVVLLPGNLAPNKGFQDFQRILQQVERLGLPIRFRVLGRVDAGIRRQLAGHPQVELAGRYGPGEFAARAAGCDLALFLSPWPETYCITFDEWARSGRACFFVAIGALSEAHRQRFLHPASRWFEPHAVVEMVAALIQAATPAGRAQLRSPWNPGAGEPLGPGFAEQHWRLYRELLSTSQSWRPVPWHGRPHQRWVEDSEAGLAPPPLLQGRALWRAWLRRLVYRLPAGHRIARLWRRWRSAG